MSDYVGKGYGHLKVDTAELVKEELARREKTNSFLADPQLDELLKRGAEKARDNSADAKRVYEQ